MRNLLLFILLHLQIGLFSQIDPSLLSMKNRQIESSNRDSIISSFNKISIKPDSKPVSIQEPKNVSITETQPTNKDVDFLNTFFEADRKKSKVVYNAFNIVKDTIFSIKDERDKKEFHKKMKDLSSKKQPLVIEKEVIQSDQKMTVMFKDGQLVPIEKSDSFKVGKQILDKFGIDVDPDDLWKISLTFEFNGEIYTKMSKTELDELEEISKKVSIKRKSKIVNKNIHQKVNSNEQGLDLYEDLINASEKFGIPPAITGAQFVLESRAGQSKMAVEINNLFGIKDKGGRCNVKGCNHGVYNDDKKSETFVRYANFEASFNDHVKFFLKHQRYKQCLECGVNNIECWLYRLQKSGYATDPQYDYKLADIINRYKLTDKPIKYSRKRNK